MLGWDGMYVGLVGGEGGFESTMGMERAVRERGD